MSKKEKNMNFFKKILDLCCEHLKINYVLILGLFLTIELISKDLKLVETYKFFSFSTSVLCFYYIAVFLCFIVGLVGYHLCKHDLDKQSNIEKLIEEESEEN